ncbi:uncharacterized protein LOC125660325 [Ostrea edulis]|uniref:uncharacterized protein LOC125660325 n=1 Tax=Ostrea edulis TaxID=37623 RepID=UPI0024AFE175|nr:uncharacterized protein LOC125660325 [Ostrea edulis]
MIPILILLLLVYDSRAETESKGSKNVIHDYIREQQPPVQADHHGEAQKRQLGNAMLHDTEEAMRLLKLATRIAIKNVVYTRWGKKTCPSKAELVHSGFVGGSHSYHSGAAVEPLCLPRDPEWGLYNNKVDRYRGLVYGAEYETNSFFRHISNHDVPCAVCLSHGRSVVEVFPARKTCYKGWNLEYSGYLMAGHWDYHAGTKYTCVDKIPDIIYGSHSNKNGYLFHHVEARCGSLKCPPYVHGRELVCAVCSRA